MIDLSTFGKEIVVAEPTSVAFEHFGWIFVLGIGQLH
jgi:hypothetical protein